MKRKSRKNRSNNEISLFDQKKYDANILDNIGKDGEMLSLTDLWKAAGSIKGKNPNDWIRQDSSQQLIDTASQILNTVSSRIIKTKRGKSGGSYAHKNIALAYAKYLDPALHVLVNEVFFQRIEEEKNPDLIVDRAITTYKRKGMSDSWISKRLTGKAKRNEFTDCLAVHGVQKGGYRNCTNAIYTPLYGGTTEVVREKLGLTKTQNIRDNIGEDELLTIQFAEMLSKRTIEDENLRGNGQCELACSRSAKIVANAVIQSKKPLNTDNKIGG